MTWKPFISVALATAALLTTLPAAAPARSAWCSESGDSCFATFVRGGVRYVRVAYAEQYVKRDTICVAGPRRSECRSGRLRQTSAGIWELRKRWRGSYSFQGPGLYRVYVGAGPHSPDEPHVSFRVSGRSARAALALVLVPATGARTVLPSGDRGVYKPRTYCPANHTCFTNARWVAWGPRRAVAWADARTSFPGSSEVWRSRTRFVFSRPREICGGLAYTRARWHQRGLPPTATSVLDVACSWTGA